MATDGDVIIRPAGVRDALEIERVRAESWRTAYRGIVKDETLERLGMDGWAERWANGFRPEEGQFVLAAQTANGEMVGFIEGGPTREDWRDYPGEIYMIYIMTSFQGRGIGSRLLCAAYDVLSAQDRVPMHLQAMKENARSLEFYRRAGGRPLGFERGFEIDGIPLIDYPLGWTKRPFTD